MGYALGLMAKGASFDSAMGSGIPESRAVAGASAIKLVLLRRNSFRRSVPGVPGAAAGGDSCDAGVCRNRQLLCDGAEHGT